MTTILTNYLLHNQRIRMDSQIQSTKKLCAWWGSAYGTRGASCRHTTYSYVRTHVRSIGTKTYSQQPRRLVTPTEKINGKGRAWHNSILSHCKIFGTRDGGTGRRADDVSGPSNSHDHVSTRTVSAPRSALYSDLLFGRLSTHLVIIAQHKALPRQPRECPNRNIESGVMGSWTVSYLD